MTTISTAATECFDTIFSAFIAGCADFCGGARQGSHFEGRSRELRRPSEAERIGFIRADLNTTRH